MVIISGIEYRFKMTLVETHVSLIQFIIVVGLLFSVSLYNKHTYKHTKHYKKLLIYSLYRSAISIILDNKHIN